MSGMKRVFVLVFVVVIATALAACGGGAAPQEPPAAPQATKAPSTGAPAAPEQPAATQPEAPAEPSGPQVPDIVPIIEGATNLNITGDYSYIAYQAPDMTLEEAIAFYQAELAARGWVQKNKKDGGVGDSITMLRTHEDYNISVTIQTIPNSTTLRVLIALTPK